MKQTKENLKEIYQTNSTQELMELINNHLEQEQENDSPEYHIWNQILQE